MNFFAVCTVGLEPVLARELGELGVRTIRPQGESLPPSQEPIDGEGGVEFQGTLHDCYRANLHLRTASRVLVRLGRFYADTFSHLRRRAKRLPWEDFLSPEMAVVLHVACHKSRLFHTGAVSDAVIAAIQARLGQPPPPAEAKGKDSHDRRQLLIVRLLENQCTIAVDSSGPLLHRRGYRLATAKAPLRETLAAAIVLQSGWDRSSPLLDPFCGAGTIVIEAALLARKIPPGIQRRFAFMDWPNFDAAMWDGIVAEAKTPQAGKVPSIRASDRDAGAVQAARENARRAGVEKAIEFSSRAISAIEPPKGPGWVVTNPPYGVRLGTGKDLRRLYAQFGNVLQAKCAGWHIAVFCSRSDLLRSTGLTLNPILETRNGGIKVKLARGNVM